MRYSYTITYRGEVDSTDEEAATEGIGDIVSVISESFKPDLRAGVVLEGLAISINQLPNITIAHGKL